MMKRFPTSTSRTLLEEYLLLKQHLKSKEFGGLEQGRWVQLIKQALKEKRKAKTTRAAKQLSFQVLQKRDEEQVAKAAHTVDSQNTSGGIVYTSQVVRFWAYEWFRTISASLSARQWSLTALQRPMPTWSPKPFVCLRRAWQTRMVLRQKD